MTKRRRYIIDTALFHYIYLFVTPDKISGDMIMISGEMTQFRATWLSTWNVAAKSNDWQPRNMPIQEVLLFVPFVQNLNYWMR